jgi:hypothetical protein
MTTIRLHFMSAPPSENKNQVLRTHTILSSEVGKNRCTSTGDDVGLLAGISPRTTARIAGALNLLIIVGGIFAEVGVRSARQNREVALAPPR